MVKESQKEIRTEGGLIEMTGTNPEFIISRTFTVQPRQLFDAWTKPELMAKWWGPKGFAVKSYKLDLKPGGVYHYCMQAPDGSDMWGKFVYREITPPSRLVFVNCFSNEKGEITRHPWHASWPLEILSTITFLEHEGGTNLIIKWEPINATDLERKTFEEGKASMQQGWGGTLDQLGDYLKNG